MVIENVIHSRYTCDVPGCSEFIITHSDSPQTLQHGFDCAQVRCTKPGIYRAVHCPEHAERFRRVMLAEYGFKFSEHG